MTDTLTIWGERVATDTHYFSPRRDSEDMDALARLRELPRLTTVSFFDRPIDDRGLAHVCGCPGIDNLVLQNTRITDDGLRHLARLPRLRHLRLKDNPQLTDACLPHLAVLVLLEDLQLHETSVTAAALPRLLGLTALRHLTVEFDDMSSAAPMLLALSKQMPWCEILAKGHGAFRDGRFSP